MANGNGGVLGGPQGDEAPPAPGYTWNGYYWVPPPPTPPSSAPPTVATPGTTDPKTGLTQGGPGVTTAAGGNVPVTTGFDTGTVYAPKTTAQVVDETYQAQKDR